MNKPTFVRDQDGNYKTKGYVPPQVVVEQALSIIEENFQREGTVISSPDATRTYLKLKLGGKKNEAFSVLFLDNRHRVIAYEELFQGTIDGASVHSRVVVQRALELNAAAVILAHNHPSGVTDPSRADEAITKRLKDALALVEVRTLDHVIVGEGHCTSFAERGLL